MCIYMLTLHTSIHIIIYIYVYHIVMYTNIVSMYVSKPVSVVSKLIFFYSLSLKADIIGYIIYM